MGYLLSARGNLGASSVITFAPGNAEWKGRKEHQTGGGGCSGTVGERRDGVLMRLDETWEFQPFSDYPG